MKTDLQAKAEKYEAKTAQCKEWAQRATDGPERALYEDLASYHGMLAMDFRRLIARRTP